MGNKLFGIDMQTKKEKDDIILNEALNKKYEYGFTTDIGQETLPPGLDENVIKTISNKKDEPEWLLDWRLNAFKRWKKMKNPNWSMLNYPDIDYQQISYYSAPKPKKKLKSLKGCPLCPQKLPLLEIILIG